jgi:hypothetical protein
MNLTLLLKEISGLRLCMALVLAITAIDLVLNCVMGFPDFPDPTDSSSQSSGITNMVADSLFYGIIFGLAVFGQEREHRTVGFLDGLPVSRLNMFAHKFFAVLLVLAAVQLFLILYAWSFDWLQRNSLSEPEPLSVWFAFSVLQFLLTLTIVGMAAFLSFSRGWFPLLAGLVLTIAVWIRLRGGSVGHFLDTSALLSPADVDGTIIWPTQQILGHLLIGVLGWTGAALAFAYRDGKVSRMFDQLATLRGMGCLTIAGYGLAAIVWIGILYVLMDSDESRDQPVASRAAGEIDYDALMEELDQAQQREDSLDAITGKLSLSMPDLFSSQRTDYFELIFRESIRDRIDSLEDSLDTVHDQVMQYFQFPPRVRGRVVVDTGSSVLSHTAGITNWTKIRVPLNAQVTDAQFLQTLRHELAHVYIEQLCDGRAGDYFGAMRVFHEGVATHVELYPEETGIEEERRKMELWAVGTDSRGRVPLGILCDDNALQTSRHDSIVYPLGYILAQSLVDIGGQQLPRRMMESLRTERFPIGARPIEIWRILLQRSGCSLESLIATYESRLEDLRKREQDFLSGLPTIKGSVAVQGDEILVRATVEGTAADSATLVAMYQKDAVIMSQWEQIRPSGENEFRLRRADVPGNRLRYILGWITPETSQPIFEPWSESILKR